MRAFSADLLTGAAVAVASLILSAPECRAAAAESAASPAATSPTPSSDFGFAYDPQDFFELTIGAPVPRGIDRLGTEGLELESRSEADDGVLYIFSDPDQPGFRASLLLREGRLVGVIDHPNELRTTITSVRAGFSVARVDDALKDLTCGCEERHLTRDPNGPDDGGGDGGVAGGPCDNGTKVDVLVVYTSAAVTQAGSTASLLDSINWAMADSNSIYAGSGVALQARLVGTALVTYTENADMSVDLDRLTGTSDGFMDNIHTIRNNVGADLVALVRADGGGACGVAWLLPSNSSANANKGFSVTALGCFSNRTFTHEMGHNMGCCHAPGDGGAAPRAASSATRSATASSAPTGSSTARSWHTPRAPASRASRRRSSTGRAPRPASPDSARTRGPSTRRGWPSPISAAPPTASAAAERAGTATRSPRRRAARRSPAAKPSAPTTATAA
ncbi:MAG: reprolysin-like metallopeptidase [Planctomycetota bacterium]